MPQLVPEGSKQNPVTAFWNFTTSFLWEFITSLDSFTKVFLIISLLVILATPIIVKNRQTIDQYASGTNKQCIPLPSCVSDGRCPEILKYKIPNVSWCLPDPTLTPMPTCIPRPACLDTEPRCLLDARNFCPATPTPTPVSNIQTVIRKAGEQEGSFLIQKINRSSVDGLWYQAYPVATNQGTPKTLYIGDDIGYACEGVSERLTSINFPGKTVTFTKVTGQPPLGGCPI